AATPDQKHPRTLARERGGDATPEPAARTVDDRVLLRQQLSHVGITATGRRTHRCALREAPSGSRLSRGTGRGPCALAPADGAAAARSSVLGAGAATRRAGVSRPRRSPPLPRASARHSTRWPW